MVRHQVKVFVNHRPVVGVSPEDIEDAFAAVGAQEGTGLISHEALLELLATRGEALAGGELTACLEELLGPGMNLGSLGSKDISPVEMAEGVLGFGGGDDGGEDEGDAEEG